MALMVLVIVSLPSYLPTLKGILFNEKSQSSDNNPDNSPNMSISNVITSDDMVFVEGGTFEMGSSDENAEKHEKPLHNIRVNDFYMARTEVSVANFVKFVSDTNFKTDAEQENGSFIYNDHGEVEKLPKINWRHDTEGNRRSTSEY